MTLAERQMTYRQLCREGHVRTLFMQPWWLDASGPWDVAFARRNGRLIGAMPFAAVRRWGISMLAMPALTHHLRIWVEKPADISAHKWLTREKQVIWSLIEALPSFGFFSLVFEQDTFENWLPFHWKGFRLELRYTFVIDRATPLHLDQQINRNLRRNLREAGSALTIRPTDDLQGCFDLIRQTHTRQRVALPFSLIHFTRIVEAARAQDAGSLLGAYDQAGRLLSAAFLLWDSERAYYFLSGDTDEGRQAGAGLLLCREALRLAFEIRGVWTFDFCGSMLESVTEIRRQFGARAVPLIKISRAGYRWLDIVYALTR